MIYVQWDRGRCFECQCSSIHLSQRHVDNECYSNTGMESILLLQYSGMEVWSEVSCIHGNLVSSRSSDQDCFWGCPLSHLSASCGKSQKNRQREQFHPQAGVARLTIFLIAVTKSWPEAVFTKKVYFHLECVKETAWLRRESLTAGAWRSVLYSLDARREEWEVGVSYTICKTSFNKEIKTRQSD